VIRQYIQHQEIEDRRQDQLKFDRPTAACKAAQGKAVAFPSIPL
jgi:hypothetical protein